MHMKNILKRWKFVCVSTRYIMLPSNVSCLIWAYTSKGWLGRKVNSNSFLVNAQMPQYTAEKKMESSGVSVDTSHVYPL